MTAKVLVQLEDSDTPVPLNDLAWEHVAPCGCTCGLMVPEGVDQEVEFARFIPNAEIRRRDVAEGFVFRLAPREAAIERMRGSASCPHDPKWGHAEVKIPEGYRWGEAYRQKRLHLVKVDPSEPKNFRNVWAAHVHGKHNEMWHDGWVGQIPTCRTCERWAQKQAVQK